MNTPVICTARCGGRCTDQYESMTWNIIDMKNAIRECNDAARYLKKVVERHPKPMETE